MKRHYIIEKEHCPQRAGFLIIYNKYESSLLQGLSEARRGKLH
jgi:hypothetical protein